MDLQKEKHNYLAMLVAEDAITQEQCSNLSLHNGGNCFHSDFLASSKVDCINWGWSAWLKAKAQAIPEGFVLVPKEPTQEMIQAGLENVRESWNDVPVEGFDSFTWGDMVSTWKDMIWAQESVK